MKIIKPSSMWRGQNPHKEILSLHCIKLWRWSPGCSNLKIVGVLAPWNVCWGQLHTDRNLAKRKLVRSGSEGLPKLFVTHIILSWAPDSKMSLSYGCFFLPCWGLVRSFFPMLLSCFGMGIFILWYCMLEVFNLCLIVEGLMVRILPQISKDTLSLRSLNNIETIKGYENF